MDRNGVATAIGCTGPIPVTANVESAHKLARENNDHGARIAVDYPGRFGLFAALPLPDVEGSLREIEYAADVLNADGFSMSTSYKEMWLGDRQLRPVFNELDRRKAVVFVHPVDALCCTAASLTYQGLPLHDRGLQCHKPIMWPNPLYGSLRVARNTPRVGKR